MYLQGIPHDVHGSRNTSSIEASIRRDQLEHGHQTAQLRRSFFGHPTTARPRRIRDPVASNTSLARSVVPKRSRQTQERKTSAPGHNILRGDARRNERGIGLEFAGRVPPSERNDLQGGSGVGAGSYSFASRQGHQKFHQDTSESVEPNDWSSQSTDRSKQKSNGNKRSRPANPRYGRGGKRKFWRSKRQNGTSGSRRKRSSTQSFKRGGATNGSGSVWGPINDTGWNNVPPNGAGTDRSLHCSADVSF